MSLWDKLKDLYSEESVGGTTEKIAMTDLIDNYLANEVIKDTASFQDFSMKQFQAFSGKIEQANANPSSSFSYYNSYKIAQESYNVQAESSGSCYTDAEKIDMVAGRFRGEMSASIRAMIEKLVKEAGSYSEYLEDNLSELQVTVRSEIASMPCTSAYNRGAAEAFLNDLKKVLAENTFRFTMNAVLQPPPPPLESFKTLNQPLSVSSESFSGFAIASVFSGYSLQVVNTSFTASMAVQDAVVVDFSGSVSCNFSFVNEATFPATIDVLACNLLNSSTGEVISSATIPPVPAITPAAPVTISITPPSIPEPPAQTTITELVELRPEEEFDEDFIDWLTTPADDDPPGAGITTFEQIRTLGGLWSQDLPYPGGLTEKMKANIRELNAFAGIDKMYPFTPAVINNVYNNYGGVNATELAISPRTVFVANSNSEEDEDVAGFINSGQAYLSNKASEKWVQSIGTGVLADLSQFGAESLAYLSPDIRAKVSTVFEERCNCSDCEAATSPLAYLSELVKYVTTYVRRKQGGIYHTIEIDELEEWFCQPFGTIISNCESMEEKVCYARISIEILRKYYAENSIPYTTALNNAISEYCRNAYELILTELGINYRELTLNKDAAQEIRKQYMDSLGLFYDAEADPSEDILNKIWHDLSPSADPVTESYLERTFGLQSTDRDGASTGLKTDDTLDVLKQWSFTGEKLLVNTDKSGCLYISISKEPEGSGYEYEVHVHKDIYASPENLVAYGITTDISGNINLLENNLSGLSGWVRIADSTVDTIIISIIPLYIASRIQYTESSWKSSDDRERVPLIDPDLIDLNDINDPYSIGVADSPAQLWDSRRSTLTGEFNNIIEKLEEEAPFYEGPWIDEGSSATGMISYRQDNDQYLVVLGKADEENAFLRRFTREDGEPDPLVVVYNTTSNASLYYNNQRKDLFLRSNDAENSVIRKIDPEHLNEEWLFDSQVFPMDGMTDLSGDDKGNIVVADSGNKRIIKYTPAGLWQTGEYVFHKGINYYLLEAAYERVTKYNHGGERIATYGYNFDNNQVALWSFDNNLIDPHGHTATGYNIVYTSGVGANEYALQLNGLNAYVSITSAADIDTNNQGYPERSIRIKFRVNNKNITQVKQVIYAQGSEESGFNIYVYGGRLYIGNWHGQSQEIFLSTDEIQNGQLHDLVVSVKGALNETAALPGGFRLYLDGRLAAVSDAYRVMGSHDSMVTLGAGENGRMRFHDGPGVGSGISGYFGGIIDELCIWNKAMFDQEVFSLYSGQPDPETILENPSRIWVDSSGSVYVLSTDQKKLQRFSEAGDLLYRVVFSHPDETPLDFAVDDEQNVIFLVQTASASELFKYNFSTASMNPVEGLSFTDAVAIIRNIDKNYYVITDAGASVTVITPDFAEDHTITGYTCPYPEIWKDANAGDGFGELVAICNDAEGNIIVADAGYNRLVRLRYNETSHIFEHLCTWGKDNEAYPGSPNPLFRIHSLASLSVDRNQQIYLNAVSSIGDVNGLYKLAMPYIWGADDETDPYYKMTNPKSVDVDENGLIYVADAGEEKIRVYNPYGRIEGVSTPFIDAGAGSIEKIRTDRLGNIYVYSMVEAAVIKLDLSGNRLTEWSSYRIGESDEPIENLNSLWLDYEYGHVFFTMEGHDKPVGINTYNELGQSINNRLNIAMNAFLAIEVERYGRADITGKLDALNLTLEAFRYLISLTQSPLALEQVNKQNFANILVSSFKKHRYQEWKEEETDHDIYLSPDLFRVHEAYEADSFSIIPWRADQRERTAWLGRLERRARLYDTIFTSHGNMISNVEDQTLFQLRDAMVLHSDNTKEPLSEKARLLSAKLFNDFEMNCCQKTTRLTQAIEALQLLPWTIRNGQISDAYPGDQFMIDSDQFDDEWKWMGSYATWRAAILVFVYPENVLDPGLRKLQSGKFREVAGMINENTRFSPADASGIAKIFQDYTDDIANLVLEDAVDTHVLENSYNSQNETLAPVAKSVRFVFATGTKTQTAYYSMRYSDDGGDKSKAIWNAVPGVTGIDKLIGAKQYYYQSVRHLFVFYTMYEGSTKKVMFTGYDLDKGEWFKEPKEMGDLQDSPANFNIFLIKHDDMNARPGFLISYHDPKVNKHMVYVHMNNEGSGFDKDGWYELQTAAYDGGTDNKDVEDAQRNALKIRGNILGGIAFTEGGTVRTFMVYISSYPGYNGANLICELEFNWFQKHEWRFLGIRKNHAVFDTLSNSTTLSGLFIDPESKNIVLSYVKNNTSSSCRYKIEATSLVKDAVTNLLGKTRRYILPVKEYPMQVKDSYDVVYQRNEPQDKIIRSSQIKIIPKATAPSGFTTITHLGDKSVQVQPFIPAGLRCDLIKNTSNLQKRRSFLADAYTKYNQHIEDAVRVTIEEAFFHLPVIIANALTRNKFYTEALDWYRMVYNFSETDEATRKIFYGLVIDAQIANQLVRPDEWLVDPMNPHGIARTRPRAYTKYTLFNIIGCMLNYADAEFTKDNVESIARARELYETALQLLGNEGLLRSNDECEKYISTHLTYTVTDPDWTGVWSRIYSDIFEVHNKKELEKLVDDINDLTGVGSIEAQLRIARELVTRSIEEGQGIKTTSEVVSSYSTLVYDINTVLSGEAAVGATSNLVFGAVSNNFYTTLEQATSVTIPSLMNPDNSTEFSWIADMPVFATLVNAPVEYVVDFVGPVLAVDLNPHIEQQINWVSAAPDALPASFQAYANNPVYYTFKEDRAPYLPGTVYQFCMPKNPVKETLVLRAELNLYKIRNCMNIGGMKRELDPFAAATDTTTGMPSIGDNGTLVVPGLGAPLPTIYRYGTLIERAKQLTNIAQQAESLYLSVLEKTDSETQQQMQAKQSVKMAEQSVKLQDLRINEAQENINLTDLQVEQAEFQFGYYNDLLSEGLIGLEQAILSIQSVIGAAYVAGALVHYGSISEEATKIGPAGKFGNILGKTAEKIEFGISALNAEMSVLSTLASNQRREQEWTFQKGMASRGIAIAKQQKKIAQAQMKVVSQERNIADLQRQQASDTLDFLQNKFTSRELYVYISKIAADVFIYFLTRATSMAKLAQTQLAFERQVTPPSFILDDYYADVSSGPSLSVSTDVEYRGISGSSRLLKDIYRLDEYAFEKDVRRLELSKTISVGRLYPDQLQNLRNTGQMTFSTPMELFDRDFPGHYSRLIKRVKVTTVALVPPADGIKATLANSGLSRAVIASNNYQFTDVPVVKTPETIAFTGTQNASGVLELQPLNDKLLPFEGLGVDTTWQFTLPKFNNFFDFDTIGDVLITIEYTALEDNMYKQEVLRKLGNEVQFNRLFSMKNEFPDQWYDISNVQNTQAARQLNFVLDKVYFPVNVTVKEIHEIGLMFVTTDGNGIYATATLTFLPSDKAALSEQERKDATRTGFTNFDNKTQRSSASGANGWETFTGPGNPFGYWTIALSDYTEDTASKTIAQYFADGRIADILFVLTYGGEVPMHPQAINLKL